MTAPYQAGEIVLRLPILDPNLPVTPGDRLIEREVNALMRFLRERSRISKPADVQAMLIAMVEGTARLMSSAATAGPRLPGMKQGFEMMGEHLAQRASDIADGQPFGEVPTPEKPKGSSIDPGDLLDALPPVAEEGDMGVLGHRIASAMSLEGLKVLDQETRSLTEQQKNGALVIAGAEAALVVALCATNQEHAREIVTFITTRIQARAEQAFELRRKKMG